MTQDRVSKKWVSGTKRVLNVLRKVEPYGHFLGDDFREVLLPTGEQTAPIEVGQELEVFIYHDSEDRIVATMNQPLIEFDQIAKLEVVDYNPRAGFFLDMGLKRHLLLPVSFMPQFEKLRPQIGDFVYVIASHDQRGRMLAKPVKEHNVLAVCVRGPKTWQNKLVRANIYNTMEVGSFAICDAGVLGFGVLGFVHASERVSGLRIGYEGEFRVTHVREDGRVNLSMRKIKHEKVFDDTDLIIRTMVEGGGKMHFTDDSTPEEILKKFKISKGAFKRAIGKLMKNGVVRQENGWTYMIQAKQAGGEHHE